MYPHRFSVGEIAIAIDPRGFYDGMECEVVKGLHHATGIEILKSGINFLAPFGSGMMYGVKFARESRMVLAFPWELRKRPLPYEHVTTDEECEVAA